MTIQFMEQIDLAASITDMRVDKSTSPAAVSYNGVPYLFWRNSGFINISTFESGQSWSPAVSFLSIFPGISRAYGSPAAIEYNGRIFLAWNGGSTIEFFTFDGKAWRFLTGTPTMDVDLELSDHREGSPALAVHDGKLYVFWKVRNKNDMAYCTLDGSIWGGKESMQWKLDSFGMRGNPTAASFNGKLVICWNGSGDNGYIYMSSMLSSDGRKWAPQSRVPEAGILSNGSPCLYGGVASADQLYLFWGGRGKNGIFYATYDGSEWSSQVSMQNQIGAQIIGEDTSPSVGAMGCVMQVYWAGGDTAWLSNELMLEISGDTITEICSRMDRRERFCVWSRGDKEFLDWASRVPTRDGSWALLELPDHAGGMKICPQGQENKVLTTASIAFGNAMLILVICALKQYGEVRGFPVFSNNGLISRACRLFLLLDAD
ncbi:glycoside hydrolase family protein [Burkholderia ubonensis]|uniref:hypothetical protein n=1 Tax=Burkholderia ubonensis TaxID=101571 RepID=UPI002ABE0B73|nr:hypothetical protein [Burkholderia ubonensis]